MGVHVRQITSEVRSLAPSGDGGGEESENRWDKAPMVASLLDQASHTRRRLATGFGDD